MSEHPIHIICVATFCEPGETRKTQVHAYTRWFDPQWEGCRVYYVPARNGTEAKKKAIELRLEDERKEREAQSP